MTVNEGHSVQGAPKARTTIGVPRGLPSAPRLTTFPRFVCGGAEVQVTLLWAALSGTKLEKPALTIENYHHRKLLRTQTEGF